MIFKTAPPASATWSEADSLCAGTSAIRNAGFASACSDGPGSPGESFFFRALVTHEAKVGYLTPHCSAKAAALIPLCSKAAKTFALYSWLY